MDRFTRCLAAVRLGVVALVVISASGCMTFYVDNQVKAVAATEFKKPDPLHPVQLLFEFQTRGATNPRNTAFLRGSVVKQVKDSGLFSEVVDGPTPGGSLLVITMNEVPVDDAAFAKGFVTGFTFGLIGTQVTEGFVCSLRYDSGLHTEPVTKQTRDAIYGTIGLASTPPSAVQVASDKEAVTVMSSRTVSILLNDLSHDPSFK